ncbi:MAG: ankyrin repeat domain-containing protein, partial [Deltaproteobacteria bacterium]
MSTNHDRILGVGGWLIVMGLALVLLACAKDKNQDLLRASAEGRLEEVTGLLNNGADVNAKTTNGWTPVNSAAAGGDLDVVTLLLDKRAVVNAKTSDGETALKTARANHHKEVEKLLT